MVTNEVSTISLLIRAATGGGAPLQQIVSFQVMRQGNNYKAVPLVDDGQRKLLKLPESLVFEFRDHCIVQERYRDAETIALIRSIIQECMLQDWME